MNVKTMIRKLYKHYGTEQAVAEATGVDQSTINRLRRQEFNPSHRTHKALEKALNKIS